MGVRRFDDFQNEPMIINVNVNTAHPTEQQSGIGRIGPHGQK
jgi:hypothetical protein